MDFFHINRNALVLRPRPELIAWANYVFPEDPIRFEDMDQHDEQDILLIPDFDSVEESLEYIRDNCEGILSVLLEDWCLDKADWPSPLDWALFERFYDYQIETSVTDTVEED